MRSEIGCVGGFVRVAVVGLAIAATGCRAADLPLGETSEAVTAVYGATLRAWAGSIPAFGCNYDVPAGTADWSCSTNGSFPVWSDSTGTNTSSSQLSGYVQTQGAYGYQCVELVQRYLYAIHRVPTPWSVNATDICGYFAARPGLMVAQTSTPVAGDLMVFGGGSYCAYNNFTFGSNGHVAVVNSHNSTATNVTQENPASTQDWGSACAKCYLHYVSTTDPCRGANVGNPANAGDYCGAVLPGGDANVLYTCQNFATIKSMACPCGCSQQPTGQNDICAACPPPDMATTTPDLASSTPADLASSAPADLASQSTRDGGGQDGTIPQDSSLTPTPPDLAGHSQNLGGGCGMAASSTLPSTSMALLLIVIAFLRRRASKVDSTMTMLVD